MEIENRSQPAENHDQPWRSLIKTITGQNREAAEDGLHLGQVLQVFRRRLPIILGVTVTTMGLVYVWAWLHPKSYQGSFELLIQSSSAEGELASSVSQETGSKSSADPPTSLKGDSTLLTVLISPKLLQPVVQKLRTNYPSISFGSLSKALLLDNPKQTNILHVTYTASDPEQVQDVINLVSQTYLNYSLESRKADIIQGIRFLDNQLPGLGQRVDYLQSQLQRFRQTYNLSDPNTQSEQLSNQINALQQQRYDNQIALKEARASYADLQKQAQQHSSESLASSALTENVNYQKLRGQLLDLDSEIAKESATSLKDNPKLQILQEQRQRLIPLLDREANQARAEVSSRIRSLESRSQALHQNADLLNVNMKQMSVRTRQYNDLQRELQIATQNLTQFLTKREALRIEAAQKEVPWELTTPPTRAIPVLVDTNRIVLLGGMMGLLLGLGIALLYDKIKNVFYTPDDLKNETTLPLLGILPYSLEVTQKAQFSPELYETVEFSPELREALQFAPEESKMAKSDFAAESQSYGDPFFIESCRSLYTNIRLLNIDRPIRSLTISSVCPGDGKTTVSVQLARMAASLGRRVLLVDVDLRNPHVHERLGLMNDRGLSDLITDEVDLDIIKQVPQESHLFALTAGLMPADPVKVLSSQKMKALMQKVEADFDLVIYDTPPVQYLVDATVVATNTEGLALVVGLGNTDRASFRRTLEALSLSPVVIIGVVANKWKGVSHKNQYPYGKPLKQSKNPYLSKVLSR